MVLLSADFLVGNLNSNFCTDLSDNISSFFFFQINCDNRWVSVQHEWIKDGAVLPFEPRKQVLGLHTSCRQLKEDEHCWRPPAAVTAPSLNCRWYGWRSPAGPCRSADPDSEPSTVFLLLTAAVLKLKRTLPLWVKPTSSPSLVCDVKISIMGKSLRMISISCTNQSGLSLLLTGFPLWSLNPQPEQTKEYCSSLSLSPSSRL